MEKQSLWRKFFHRKGEKKLSEFEENKCLLVCWQFLEDAKETTEEVLCFLSKYVQ